MKFSSLAVLAVVAPFAAGFAPIAANQRSLTNVVFVKPSASKLMMSLEDLEKKATAGDLRKVDPSQGYNKRGNVVPEPKPEKKAAPPKPVKAERPTKKAAPKEVEMPVFEKPAEKPVVSKKGIAPKKAEKVKADQYTDIPTSKKVEKTRPQPFAAKAPIQPKRAAPPKPVPAPKAPVVADPNALRDGVALGAAPLLLAPLVALTAGRSVLAGTKARREKIQKEIAAAEAAKLRKIKESAVDGYGVVGALAYFGAGAAALGLIVTAPLDGFKGPDISMSSISAPSPTIWGKMSASAPPSVVKKAEAKIAKKLKADGYDFGMAEEVKVAKRTAVKAKAKVAKEEVQVKKADATAEKAAEKEAKAVEAEDKAVKAKKDAAAAENKAKEAEAKAEKEAGKAKTDQEKAAAEVKAKESVEKEKAAAAEKAKTDAAEKEAKGAEEKAKKEADAAADKARAEETKAAAVEKEAKAAAAKAKTDEEMAKKVKAEEAAAAAKVEASKPAPAAPKAAPAAPAPAPTTTTPEPASSSGKGLGVVTGSEAGGKVLPKEEVSADLLKMLKAKSSQ